DAKEIVVGRCRGGGVEEEAFAGADLDFEWSTALEQCVCVPRLRQIVERLEVATQVERGVEFSQGVAWHSQIRYSEIAGLRSETYHPFLFANRYRAERLRRTAAA